MTRWSAPPDERPWHPGVRCARLVPDRAIAAALDESTKKLKKRSDGPKSKGGRKRRKKPDEGSAGAPANVS